MSPELPNSSIKPLLELDHALARPIITGYVSQQAFQLSTLVTPARMQFTLELQPLAEPFHGLKPLSDADLDHYAKLLPAGLSYQALVGTQCVGLAIAEAQPWNQTLLIWEFHVAQAWRGRGIGRQLMAATLAGGQAAGLRAAICETQAANVAAIRFYQAQGFVVAGFNTALYANPGHPQHETALWMAHYGLAAS